MLGCLWVDLFALHGVQVASWYTLAVYVALLQRRKLISSNPLPSLFILNRHISANSSVVTITKVLPSRNRQLDIGGTSSSSSSNPASIAAKLLQHHLSHTMISRDEAHVPSANPQLPPPLSSLSQNASQLSSSSQEPLNFASFISLFPSSDASSPASIFKLGSALFDSIDLRLGHQKSNSVSPDVRNRVQILRRKASLSKWLEETVKYAVDGDLRIEASGSNGDPPGFLHGLPHLTLICSFLQQNILPLMPYSVT